MRAPNVVDRSTSAACNAVERYARDVARLPAFPVESPSFGHVAPNETDVEIPDPVLKATTTESVPGEVLPRGDDVWLALLPFDDLTKADADATTHDVIQKRRALLAMLATLATSSSSPFRLDPLSTSCGESVGPPSTTNTFWIDVLRSLCAVDASTHTNAIGIPQELPRWLITASHERALRFMVCINQDVASGVVHEWIEQLLVPLTAAGTLKDVDDVLAACGLASGRRAIRLVEIGLSFSKGTISHSFLSKLLDVVDRTCERRDHDGGVAFQVTTLRFGKGCVFQAKALELLGQRASVPSLHHIRLGELSTIKPASISVGLGGLLRQQRGVRRLTLTASDGFKAVASTLRNGDSCLKELDAVYEPTLENAAWLAFALFHIDAKSRVASLRLRLPRMHNQPTGTLSSAWLAAFQRALCSTTADHDLACTEGGNGSHEEASEQARRFVVVEAGTPVKAEPYASAKLLCRVDDATRRLEAIATVGTSIAVIVPGLGVGWVSTASVISETLVSSQISRETGTVQTNRRVTTLIWDGAPYRPELETHVTTLLELLEIVGEPLERLHLPAMSITTEQLARILTACPNLTDLNVSGHTMVSIAPLVDAYASGRCRIETLSIARSGAWTQEDSTPQEMATILQSPGGRTLRQLAIHSVPLYFVPPASLAAHRESTRALFHALTTSHTLEFVQLPGSAQWTATQPGALPSADDHHVLDEDPAAQLSVGWSTHPCCFAPLPMAHKLAFLSCLPHQGADSALGRFDACVLAVIFRLSGHAIARRVILDAPLVFGR